MRTRSYKQEYGNEIGILTLLSIIPPLAMLFIIVGWYRGSKVNAISIVGMILGVVLSVVYYMQLSN